MGKRDGGCRRRGPKVRGGIHSILVVSLAEQDVCGAGSGVHTVPQNLFYIAPRGTLLPWPG